MQKEMNGIMEFVKCEECCPCVLLVYFDISEKGNALYVFFIASKLRRSVLRALVSLFKNPSLTSLLIS